MMFYVLLDFRQCHVLFRFRTLQVVIFKLQIVYESHVEELYKQQSK
jgi:hypothetical protein